MCSMLVVRLPSMHGKYHTKVHMIYVILILWCRLIERVHLVTAVKTTRLRTCQYKFHIVLLCPYVVIFVLMVCDLQSCYELHANILVFVAQIDDFPQHLSRAWWQVHYWLAAYCKYPTTSLWLCKLLVERWISPTREQGVMHYACSCNVHWHCNCRSSTCTWLGYLWNH